MYKDAHPAGEKYGLVYLRATQGTILSPTPTHVRDPQFRISANIHHRLKPV
jgi:hypothetical protein